MAFKRDPKGQISRYMKILAFASICFMALLPSAVIGYFQQVNAAKDNIVQLALHLTTLHHMAKDAQVSPQAAVFTTQNNKLVLWSVYLRGGLSLAKAGLAPVPGAEKRLQVIQLDPQNKIVEQLPAPNLLTRPVSDYKLRLPLASRDGVPEFLELGVSYSPLYSTAQDQFALSTVLFLTAFVFLLGAVIFIDLNVSKIASRVIRAIRTESSEAPALDLGIAEGLYAPTFNALMEALDRREDQLIDTRDTLESVFDGLQMGVSMLSTEMRIVMVNRFLMKALGRSGEEALISQPASVLGFASQEPPIEGLLKKAAKSLEYQSQDIEIELQGERKHFTQEVYPLFGEGREPIAFIYQCRDVTAEKIAQLTMRNFNVELQKQLAFQKSKLEETHLRLLQSSRLAAVGELAGGVAHEINNPNGVILAGAKYVLNRVKDDPAVPEYVSKYLERIVKQSDRVADIVRALLTFSRRRPQEKGLLSVKDAVGDALEIFQARLEKVHVQVTSDIPADLGKVRGNRNELAQVFLNLLNNAMDAMPEGGVIRISAQSAELGNLPAVRVLVRDSGTGIPSELLDKVMEPFFTTKPVGKGTGLGLSISHGIIEEHDGTLKVRNHPEGGAEFEIVLPSATETDSGSGGSRSNG